MPIPHTHVFLGNVGGTGKTLFSAFLADYLQLRGKKVQCYSADSQCLGLEEYRGVQVKSLRWDYEGQPESLKASLEAAAGSQEQISIIDFGTSGFRQLFQYLRHRQFRPLPGWELHLPLTRTSLRDTNFAMRYLLNRYDPEMPLVLWLNQLHGPLTLHQALDSLALWPANIEGAVPVDLLSSRSSIGEGWSPAPQKTLSQLIEDASLGLRQRARFRRLQQQLVESLDEIYSLPSEPRKGPAQLWEGSQVDSPNARFRRAAQDQSA